MVHIFICMQLISFPTQFSLCEANLLLHQMGHSESQLFFAIGIIKFYLLSYNIFHSENLENESVLDYLLHFPGSPYQRVVWKSNRRTLL